MPESSRIHLFCFAVVFAALSGVNVARADEPPTTPSVPATPATVAVDAATPAPPPAGVVVDEIRVHDPKADEWLDRIEHKSDDVKTLSASVRYDRNNGLTGSKQRRFGTLRYTAGPPSRFAIHFNKLLSGRRPVEQKLWYVYDGRWLVEKKDDEKLFVKYRVANPDSSGDAPQRDPLALGEGPFPVPIGQSRAAIEKRFDVAMVDPADSDPENSVHLRLNPRTGHRVDFTYIDLWYNRDTLLPVRVYAMDEDSQDEMVVDLTDVEINTDIDSDIFDTSPPSEHGQRGWREEINP